jgi:hypothetical protein
MLLRYGVLHQWCFKGLVLQDNVFAKLFAKESKRFHVELVEITGPDYSGKWILTVIRKVRRGNKRMRGVLWVTTQNSSCAVENAGRKYDKLKSQDSTLKVSCCP